MKIQNKQSRTRREIIVGETDSLNRVIGHTDSGDPVEFADRCAYDPQSGSVVVNGVTTLRAPAFKSLLRDAKTGPDILLNTIEAYAQFSAETFGPVKSLKRVEFIAEVDAAAKKVFRGNAILLQRFREFALLHSWLYVAMNGRAASADILERSADFLAYMGWKPSTILAFQELLVPELLRRGLYPVERYLRTRKTRSNGTVFAVRRRVA